MLKVDETKLRILLILFSIYMDKVDTNDGRDVEVDMTNFKIRSWYSPGESEENAKTSK